MRIEVSANEYVHLGTWETYYDSTVVEAIRRAKGDAYLCDELAREEDPLYIRPHIEATLDLCDRRELAGKALLDFGCGCGSSSIILSELLPDTHITGLELDPLHLEAARARAAFHELSIDFLQSPSGDALPDNLENFDAIFLPAVLEHLLPHERTTLLPMLWEHLNPGGILFIDETPWRWFPIETHTTGGLPGINYLPPRLAAIYARVSPRITKDMDWSQLLRMGIRGATVREILRVFPGEMVPHDPVATWEKGYARSSTFWRRMAPFLRVTRIVPYLSLAIRKR